MIHMLSAFLVFSDMVIFLVSHRLTIGLANECQGRIKYGLQFIMCGSRAISPQVPHRDVIVIQLRHRVNFVVSVSDLP
ncbi:hypothetical protein V1506DRAFT_535835 [Lipomyces tetrasporus]